MKKFLIILSSMLFVIGLQAQEDPVKMLKKASRLVGSYNLDPSSNGDKLEEASSLIDVVLEDEAMQKSAKAWQTYGEINLERINKAVQALVLDPSAEIENPRAGLSAFEGFRKALSFAEKSFEKKDALKGITNVLSNVSYTGSLFYQKQDFAQAYESFNATVEGDKLLTENGEEPFFNTNEERMDQMYYAGISAISGDLNDEARPLFKMLMDMDYESGGVYEAMYKITKDDNPEEAAGILEKGRQKFPEDTGLLYAEINHYLALGELDKLIEKLQAAKELEPDNLSVITTLGNVYDQLYQKALEEKNDAKAKEYFDKALATYSEATKADPDYFDAIYSVGALYYNKAAAYSVEMNTLADDYTPEGTKKYEAKKVQMNEMFDKALPIFVRAEELKGDDVNTLIALKEIYARKENFDLVEKYKMKIEALDTGGEE